MKKALFVYLAVLALGLTACNSGGNSTPNTGPCHIPVTYQVIYPIPSATNVPDAPQQIVFAMSSALNTSSSGSWNVILGPDTNSSDALNSGISLSTLQTITQQQIPSPSAPVTIPNPTYQSSVVGFTFNSMSTAYIFLNNLNSTCSPVYTGAHFTTI